ncbi:MAG: transposase [Actinobacteria bacterium]|nr:transposase [Actinomycetota bacterium]
MLPPDSRHAEALIGLFSQVLGLCERAGLVRLGTIAIDGTKVRANASKERFAPVAEAADLLAEAEARDAAEEQLDTGRQDALRGASGAGAPAERRARFDQAAESLTDDEPAAPRPAGPEPRQSNKAKGRQLAAERKGSHNLTDPDSRVMKARRGWVQGYNAQVAVDDNHVIVACDVSSAVNDHRLLEPMVAAARRASSAAGGDASGGPSEFIADSGYWNGEAVERLHAGGERLLVPPNGRPRTRGLGGSSTVTKMTEILAEPDTARRYRRRQALVEPVIAHVKCNRRLDRFLLRGQAGVRLEWALGCTAHNLHRLARAG